MTRWEYGISVGVFVPLSLLAAVHADPLQPVMPTFHGDPGKLLRERDPCPSDVPVYQGGWCVSEAWFKQQHDMAPATQADIERLQQQIDEIRRR